MMLGLLFSRDTAKQEAFHLLLALHLRPVELSQMETPGFPLKQPQQDPESELQAGGGIKPKVRLEELQAAAGGIKPKVEPAEEQELTPTLPPPAFDDDDDWEITPLTGEHPFFSTVMSKSHLHKFQLVIPARVQRHLPEARVPVTLLCRGRSWPASYCGDLKVKKLDVAAWRDFAVDNGLRVGDACVFELIAPAAGTVSEGDGEAVEFRVQVLRGGLPEEITSKGATSDEPLVIVD